MVVLPETRGVPLVGGVATADLDPGYYWFTEVTPAGASAVRYVPAGGIVSYAELVEVDPATLEPSAEPSPAWVAMALAGGGTYELRGVGSPEGRITAPVGTYYTDTAGTGGAWRWLKTFGDQTFGWAVQFGDTGVRNVADMFPEIGSSDGFTPLIYARRIGSTVSLSGARMSLPWGQTLTAQEVPVGFRPPLAVNVVTSLDLDTTPDWLGRVIMRDGTNQGFKLRFETMGARTWLTFNATYNTPDPWPAVLPGVAVV